jgi:hypothetical protein
VLQSTVFEFDQSSEDITPGTLTPSSSDSSLLCLTCKNIIGSPQCTSECGISRTSLSRAARYRSTSGLNNNEKRTRSGSSGSGTSVHNNNANGNNNNNNNANVSGNGLVSPNPLENGKEILSSSYLLEGPDGEVLVALQLPSEYFRKLPEECREMPIACVPVFIQQGVNEMQSLAIAMRHDIGVQHEIIERSTRTLKSYVKSYCALVMKSDDGVARRGLAELMHDAKKLKTMASDLALRSEKNVELLALTADLTRRVGGGRIVCCKSAKDRTSMSVTWEYARILCHTYGLAKDRLPELLDDFRDEGVRRANVIKNTGKKLYAFNNIQRPCLPPELCPGSWVCGSTAS